MTTRAEALARLTAAGEPYELVEIEAIGRRVKAFANAPPTLRELYATTRSDQTFLVYEGERLTFEETWVRACTLAHALVEDFGVRKGDRVAIAMRNYPEWVIAFMAATSIGAIAVAVNALWQPDELDYGLSHSGSKVLIADRERIGRATRGGERALAIPAIAVRTDDLPQGARAWAEVMARTPHSEMPEVDFGPDDDAIMFFTSGSTGHPKGVVSTHRGVISALLSWELDAKTAVFVGLIPAPDPEAPQQAALLGIPLFHVTGCHNVFLMCYRTQRRMVSMYKWDAAKAAELVERERITAFTAPSAVTGDLIAEAARSGHDLSSLSLVGGGGAARAPEQVRAIAKAFGKALPATGWGMTETNAIGAGIGYQDYLDHPESSGRCSAVLELRIVDEAGKVLPANARGELQVRGTSIMREYWNRPDANAESFVDGDWFRTGDVAYLDPEGYLVIVDRIKDVVIRGGENIGCGAVEAALQEHPAVQEACVYGVPDARMGEEVAATVYATAPVSERELQAFLEPLLAKFEIPRFIRVETQPLVRGATGKILKREIRKSVIESMTEPAGRG
ncbi:MAG: class I adenylate-forming enzyme family protein [Hyphomonadaceae bacterium]